MGMGRAVPPSGEAHRSPCLQGVRREFQPLSVSLGDIGGGGGRPAEHGAPPLTASPSTMRQTLPLSPVPGASPHTPPPSSSLRHYPRGLCFFGAASSLPIPRGLAVAVVACFTLSHPPPPCSSESWCQALRPPRSHLLTRHGIAE